MVKISKRSKTKCSKYKTKRSKYKTKHSKYKTKHSKYKTKSKYIKRGGATLGKNRSINRNNNINIIISNEHIDLLINKLDIKELKASRSLIKSIINGPDLIGVINKNLGVDGDNIFIKKNAGQVIPDASNSMIYRMEGTVFNFTKDTFIKLAANFLPRFKELNLVITSLKITGDYNYNVDLLTRLFKNVHIFDGKVISKNMSYDNSKILSIEMNINGTKLEEIPFLLIKNNNDLTSCESSNPYVELLPTYPEDDEGAVITDEFGKIPKSAYHCCRPADSGDKLGCGGPTRALAAASLGAAAASKYSSMGFPHISAPLGVLSAGLGAAAAYTSNSKYTKARNHLHTKVDLCCLD